ncbi:MAG: hypothetical protein COT38_00835 [Candidatus Omnitrophica bacterium CG08_land_8_20_14_0_20_41_16]|uniref:HD-GYP domain-containing protein n=1 Tax=Candidatus Sherwoodlollariibacterium unditelluris TaxID=1974757 RepID=A0A2G9YK47_9BACT|nr:MAG: hypothetical protein COX41_01910 [Candidatus Omnitrophica bacterium CG23_combo_of_CG06-09_8_20_14_all_41_10]PIS34282.1 MAG: hypothetical protein COT38_00835 [Candidatus Omnitrophica bacterium CG08_land_8_20_14_0_20_41_16]
MKERIEVSFRDFLGAIQAALLYGAGHPIVKKAIEKAHQSITDCLTEKAELTIGIIGEELAFEKEIFFDLSKLAKPGITYLKDRSIEKITFKRGFQLVELEKFIVFLVMPKEDVKKDLGDYLKFMGVHNIIAGKVGVVSKAAEQALQQALDRKGLYEHSLEEISQPLIGILNREAIDGLALKLAINNIVDKLGTQYQQLLKLDTLKRYDLGTFTHLINVSILSMYFSSKIGFTKEIVLDIGLAALFHDIGKLYISRKIIRKPGQLSSMEFSQMESHTVLGSALLLQYIDTLGIMPVVVSFEHHLRCDLSGYPKAAFPKKPHIISQIVSICDTYDALSARRSYKVDYPPDMIYNLMMRGKGTTYASSLLEKFFQLIGVWPIGSIVSLSDKRTAVVVDENQDDIFSPIVKVIYPEKEEVKIDLKGNKDGLKIERYLNPRREGKDFLHLI